MNKDKVYYVVATHGKLSQGFTNTIEVLTHKHNIHAITAYLEDEFPQNLLSLMNTFDKDSHIVIFTDLICGSVTQKIMELYGQEEKVHLFAGVNLSLMLEVILYDQIPDDEYCDSVVQAAKNQICYFHTMGETRE